VGGFGSPDGLVDPPHFQFEGNQDIPGSVPCCGGNFDFSVDNKALVGLTAAAAGDLNGDGYDDIVFGSTAT
jgi:hypothetical protein